MQKNLITGMFQIFFKTKLEFLIFNKSYLYSNICGYGHEYKSKYGGDIEDLIH